MVSDFKYIIKRILIGVGIALVLAFLKGGLILNTHALTSSYSLGAKDESFGSNYAVFQYSTRGQPWQNYTDGTLTFSFVAYKTGGDSISANAFLRHVVINSSSGASYACNVGTASVGNSTFNNGLFSATCPVSFPNNSYFQSIVFYFDSNNSVTGPSYRFLWNGLITYSSKPDSNTNVNVDTSSTNNAINNQTQNDNTNTQNIINNQNQNTQDIINNQNTNTDKEIESQKVCSSIDKANIVETGSLTSDGSIDSSVTQYGITDFINITSSTIKPISIVSSNRFACFYNINKSLISCISLSSMSVNTLLTIPENATFFRSSILTNQNRPTYEICTNGNQAIVNSQQENTNAVNNVNDTLNDDSVDTQQATNFFDSFQTNSHGLSGIITSPLRLIQSLSSSQCSSLVLPLPFVNQSATIPCMSTVYSKFPTFYNLWQLITTGMIAYYILIKLFGHVKGMQNPNDDRIEVLNL